MPETQEKFNISVAALAPCFGCTYRIRDKTRWWECRKGIEARAKQPSCSHRGCWLWFQ